MWRSFMVVLAACSFHGTGKDQPAAIDAPLDDSGAPPGSEVVVPVIDVPDACDPGTAYRRHLTFANGTRTENLDDFPVMIAFGAGDVGADLRFEDPDGRLLDYEIEHRDSNGVLAWVKVPRIDANSDADYIVVVWGDPAIATLPNPAAVWSSGYVGVWHFDDLANGSYVDSTSTPNSATETGSKLPTPATGPVGNALTFDGSNDNLDVAAEASLGVTTMTLEAYVSVPTPTAAGWGAIVEYGRMTQGWYGLWRSGDTPNHFHFRWSGGGTLQTLEFARVFTNDAWHYIAGTIDTGSHVVHTYQDGTPDDTATNATSGTAATNALTIGGVSSNAEYWKGSVDEVRISKVVRSAAWISAQHAAMTKTFVTIGPSIDPPCL